MAKGWSCEDCAELKAAMQRMKAIERINSLSAAITATPSCGDCRLREFFVVIRRNLDSRLAVLAA